MTKFNLYKRPHLWLTIDRAPIGVSWVANVLQSQIRQMPYWSVGAGRPTFSLEYPKEYRQRAMATKFDVVARAEHVMVGRVYKKSEARQ